MGICTVRGTNPEKLPVPPSSQPACPGCLGTKPLAEFRAHRTASEDGRDTDPGRKKLSASILS